MAGTRRKYPTAGVVRAPSSLLVSAVAAKRKISQVREPVAVDAPPVSSSEEESGGEAEEEPVPKDSSTSSNGFPKRGDIGRTAYKGPAQTEEKKSYSFRHRPPAKGLLIAKEEKQQRSKEEKSSQSSAGSSQGTKRPFSKEQPPLSDADNDRNKQVATGLQFDRSRKPPRRVGYSRKGPSLLVSRSGSGPTKGRTTRDSEDEDITEPEKSGPKFIRPPRPSPEKDSPVKKFRHRTSFGSDEDEELPLKTAKFKFPGSKGARDEEIEASPPRRRFTTPQYGKNKENAETVPIGKAATLGLLQGRQKWRQRQQKRGNNGASSLFGKLDLEKPPDYDDEDRRTPKAVFRMPASYEATDDSHIHSGGDDDDKELPGGDWDDNDGAEESNDTLAASEPLVCPLCKAPLDVETVDALLSIQGTTDFRLYLLKFDDKMRFCAGHKQRASEKTWQARGYPDIDWTALDARLPAHYAHVRRVLEGETPSTFRAALEGQPGRTAAAAAARESKAEKTTAERRAEARPAMMLLPGYYGQRGLRVLSEAVVREFASILRRRAVADPLIAARGSSQFVQQVLVPELAVQLIREDMSVGAAEAARILRESGHIGELVHEELDDVVMDDDGDEDEDEENSCGEEEGEEEDEEV